MILRHHIPIAEADKSISLCLNFILRHSASPSTNLEAMCFEWNYPKRMSAQEFNALPDLSNLSWRSGRLYLQNPTTIPEGYELVPKEETPEHLLGYYEGYGKLLRSREEI